VTAQSEWPRNVCGTQGMGPEVALTPFTKIETGTVYIVTWADDTDADTIRKFTPRCAYPEAGRPVGGACPAWLMIGAQITRLDRSITRQGGDPTKLEVSPWTDLSSIADIFAQTFGFPGRIGFDLIDRGANSIDGHEFGGSVAMVEADIFGGAEVTVRPLAIGEGWVGLVARVSPVQRVLAIPAKAVATVTANMLGSERRRTRSEALVFLAAHAAHAHPSLLALLSRRSASTGKPELEVRATRMGGLIGSEVALPCPTLFDFAEVGGRAAISIAAGAGEYKVH
jgi:hypothetical protein